MKLYVGNLPFKATEDELRELFGQHGAVLEVALPMDRQSGRPRGFAFVTMENAEGGQKACEALNGYAFQGRNLTVNEARPPEPRSGGGGGYGGGGGGYGGGGRGGDRDRKGGKPWQNRDGGYRR